MGVAAELPGILFGGPPQEPQHLQYSTSLKDTRDPLASTSSATLLN